MSRTLEDAVKILEVIAGYDPDDPITEICKGKVPENYTQFLDEDGLQGAKIGVFRFYTDLPHVDSQVVELFEKALEVMKIKGAKIVDPFVINNFGSLIKNLWCDTFRYDVNKYFNSLGDKAPVKNLLEVYNSNKFSLYIKKRLYQALEVPSSDKPACHDVYHEPRNIRFRKAVLEAMEKQEVDFIVYPTWSNPPNRLTNPTSHAGDNSQLIPPHTGMPALSIPMGFTYKNLPAGLQIVGRIFAEPELIRVAYAYEQATQHRRPPKNFR